MHELELFKNLTESELSYLCKYLNATNSTFKKNMTIMSNLGNSSDIGVIKKGNALLIRIDYNGNRSIVSYIEKGDIFGGLFNTSSIDELIVVSNSACEIVFLEYDNIFKYTGHKWCQKFIVNLFMLISQKINYINKRVELLTKKTIREKLLEYFHLLEKEQKSTHIIIPFSRIELAEYLAVDRSAMLRELKKLKEEGIININRNHVKIIYR